MKTFKQFIRENLEIADPQKSLAWNNSSDSVWEDFSEEAAYLLSATQKIVDDVGIPEDSITIWPPAKPPAKRGISMLFGAPNFRTFKDYEFFKTLFLISARKHLSKYEIQKMLVYWPDIQSGRVFSEEQMQRTYGDGAKRIPRNLYFRILLSYDSKS